MSSEGSFTSSLSSLESGQTYYYVAAAKVHDRECYGEIKSFTVLTDSDYGEAVDLGLSVMWRNCNLGATAPEEYGDFYAWGETETKNDYSWETYKWCQGSSTTLTKYNTDIHYGQVDNKTELESDDDVASVKLGHNWHTPTKAEYEELLQKCKWTWTTQNGVNGVIFTSFINGNTLFLPATGYKWHKSHNIAGQHGMYLSANINYRYPYITLHFELYSGGANLSESQTREYGYSIRPVYVE